MANAKVLFEVGKYYCDEINFTEQVAYWLHSAAKSKMSSSSSTLTDLATT